MTGPTVSLAEAARRCGVSPTTVRRWVREGKLPGAVQVIGAGYTIPVTDLDAFLPPLPKPSTTLAPIADKLAEHPNGIDAARARELDDLRRTVDDLRQTNAALLATLDRLATLIAARSAAELAAADARLAARDAAEAARDAAAAGGGGRKADRRRWWNRAH